MMMMMMMMTNLELRLGRTDLSVQLGSGDGDGREVEAVITAGRQVRQQHVRELLDLALDPHEAGGRAGLVRWQTWV